MNTKNYVLELLEAKRGQSISGETMANQIGVTRNTIWKAINELRKDGYIIKAVTNKGYLLCDDNNFLSVQGMIPFLSNKETSHNISIHATLESTNKTAKELAISGAEQGTIIIANCQTAGKGRYGRNFFSPPDSGIYMSFILRPSRHDWITNPTLITAFAAVSVCKAIEVTTGKTPQIKWVNDIFLDGKKICGILTEGITDFESGNMQWIIVGIGINFITSDLGLPDEIKHIAGALFPENKPTITRNKLAAEVVNHLTTFENKGDGKTMLLEYEKRLMMIGERVVITGHHEPFEAIVHGIDHMGRLIVERTDGKILTLAFGEIRAHLKQKK